VSQAFYRDFCGGQPALVSGSPSPLSRMRWISSRSSAALSNSRSRAALSICFSSFAARRMSCSGVIAA